MYIPAHFRNNDEEELLDFMRKNSFGMIISNGPTVPMVTHIPFTIDKHDKQIVLTSHYAAANPHSQLLKTGDMVTVVFSGPHGYISPSLYDSRESVPTWNYIAVHAVGEYAVSPEEDKNAMLRTMIKEYDPDYMKQYDELSPKYLQGMMKGFVGFTIRVTELQGKYKLSQNKNPNERARIAEHLEGEKTMHDLAQYMKQK